MNRRSKLMRREGIAGLLFVTPQLIYFLLFFLLPLGICIYAGFTNWNILSPNRMFTGLRNFERLFADPKFWTALQNTFYMLIPIPFYLCFALAFAYCCHKKILGEKVFRVIYYLPFISSIVALTLIWKWLFNSQYGLVNNFLGLFGIDGPDWLGDPVWTKRMIVIMISWKMIGIISIYYIAALKNVPSTYYEAAQLDGATSWQQFRKITLPMLTPTTFYLLITGMIGSLQTFLEVQLFAPDGGRGYGVGTIVFYIWQKAFDSSQMGYACACASIFGLFIMILTIAQFAVSRKWVYEGE
ncbi:carbohydrate ABC transporter permease [Ruthenibacterium lactatiformans]|jgi:multiple sugar transport system permease protein|uniref:carbohydrate ABC transporter permease n=1 Tax=Ruthenibacterium lactatiformans TaxID=1550024 RepID=UPI00155A3A1D|nr:sugar ABC transporter permease [Ruthenibacterium lactatiformans]